MSEAVIAGTEADLLEGYREMVFLLLERCWRSDADPRDSLAELAVTDFKSWCGSEAPGMWLEELLGAIAIFDQRMHP